MSIFLDPPQPRRERCLCRAMITKVPSAQLDHRSLRPLPVIRFTSSPENITIHGILSRIEDIKCDLLLLKHVLLYFQTALGSNSSQCQQLAQERKKGGSVRKREMEPHM